MTKVFVIGHDPRLQKSDSIAEYCFFADYFFKAVPIRTSELAKYKLAENLYSYVGWLTSHRYTAEQVLITNLCNQALKHAPKGKTVFISEEFAKDGLKEILKILSTSPKIELILAMSQQVNYWLQKLGFYSSSKDYLEKSEPKAKAAKLGYYEPRQPSPFLEICGNKYIAGGKPLYPVLHLKQFPLKA